MSTPSRRARTTALLLTLVLGALVTPAEPPEKAHTLRNLGLAQLENEQPAEAEATFGKLVEVLPDDPLGWADLAVAHLRQQESELALEAIDKALEKAPGRPDLLAIRAEILQWAGREQEALELLQEAARKAPRALEIVYALYRLASTLTGEEAARWERQTLEQLSRLRPENAVVISALGRRAIEAGDRSEATRAYQRLEELAWQGPAALVQTLEQVLDALEAGELAEARVPSLRLENVLKITPMYQQGLRELTLGIQGVPVTRFRDEPPPESRAGFGEPAEVRFVAERVAESPSPAGHGLAVAELDGDETPDTARLVAGEAPRLELHLSSAEAPRTLPVPAGRNGLLVADLDNDGHRDLLAHGSGGITFWRGGAGGAFSEATEALGLAGARGSAAAVLDFDIEGDLDLALFGPAPDLYRNTLRGPLEAVGAKAFPELDPGAARQLVASDLDRDGDLDLLLAHARGLLWIDNLRQGRFTDRTVNGGLAGAGATRAVATADLDNDGRVDLVAVTGEGALRLWGNREGSFRALDSPELPDGAEATSIVPADLDNDGRIDLAVAGETGIHVLAQRGTSQAPRFELTTVQGAPGPLTALAVADLDRDGDLDLVAAGPAGLVRITNHGGNRNHWLQVRLQGLATGNSKNNRFGVGSRLEVTAGAAYQLREADGGVTHFGLGRIERPDTLRVTWTNGVPQHRVQPRTDQRVVEEQVLKGSCPFLYTWDGEGFRFVTDLLWGSPAGLPVAPGVYAPADPEELVVVPGAVAEDGLYRMAVTEELWEAAFFDLQRLWIVDHPADVEVASSLRIVPGERVPERVLGTRELRPVAAAWDGRGREVTDRVARRDEVYADGYTESPYQGVAAEPWSLTFDLGEAPTEPIRLHLTGWIFPADASLNLAVSQREDLAWQPPRLEVERADGRWETLLADPGFPAGKTKTMVVDTPPLPPGARRLRLVTTAWLHWDRIAWSRSPADGVPRVVARLAPASAELRYRGFSRMVRHAPNAPHRFVYDEVTERSPWLPFPGRYTRYGEVGELLEAADSRSVILAAGDEMMVTFDASHLPPPPDGWERTVMLESHGWDKDADRNTYAPQQVAPLPFRGMSGYPYGPDEAFPDTPAHRAYREEWLTRSID